MSLVFAQATDVIAEVRVHGNHTTPDADVLAIAGLRVGESATEARLDEAGRRLRASERFEAVEVRRRYRSISNPTEILVVLLVDERVGVRCRGDACVAPTPGPLSRIRHAGMWLPILNKGDGHALTYGARVSFVDPLGSRSRISMPLTWGGERRAAVEIERTFDVGATHASPLPSTLRGGVAIHRRINPHFQVPDTRREVTVQAERSLTRWLRAGADARLADVTFGLEDQRPAFARASADGHHAAGAYLTLDTRIDPSFPRNAIHTTVRWERLAFRRPGDLDARRPEGLRLPMNNAGRLYADLRGYVGIGGSAVLALRGQASRADAPLPLSEQALLGGSDSLRGYRAGHRAGDSIAAVSAEARFPLTSPLNVGRFGVTAFIDAGTAWIAGTRLADQRFDRGIGGGVYFGAAAVAARVDVAWPETGKPRLHAGLGVTF